MEKVLVTGGNGFIGNHLVNQLLSMGIKVLVLDKSIYKPTYYNIKSAEFIEGDVLSQELLHQCLQQVDTCFHLAAIASVPLCARDWMYSHENNVITFNKLLDEIKKLSHPVKLIYASSSAVYGSNKNLPLNESQMVVPDSVYGATKLANEIYAQVMQQNDNIPSIGLRIFNVYGPGQIGSNYSGVITLFKQNIDKNQPLIIFGDGRQTRDFIYIDDVIEAMMRAARMPYEHSGIFNICSGKAISIHELAELMMRLMNTKIPIHYENKRKGDIYHSYGDNSLAKEKLNFIAQTSLEEGLKYLLKAGKTLT
ncbi:NAD-dependent epimerase/dehydratase family protein [Legionella israelensis]|uniref:NAD-dependent epimerase/dehydratase family protein n=1 Tax=Legionella israelensis TaxID=454 RepID=A0AAX1EI51_9GAMM|nr:NAD-dependent epimerase/dehydratase family protein [Legionella israelensis]QBR84474.1 NAD-dependent epimerase/dehydratase family protein [Legionella israelensis]